MNDTPIQAPRRLAVLALAAALALAGAGGAHAGEAFKASSAEAEAALGSHALRMLDGSSTTLASLHGHVVVVNFWASWCAPCRRELPRLDALSRRLASRGARVVAVSIDENRENARAYVTRGALKLPVAHDGPDGLARDLDLRNVPATIVLDGDGRVAWSTARSDDAALAQLEGVVRRLSAASPVADGGAAR
jgi:cytochrome c biogenesis protein CcmG, thiol:disulfide interchange protein DsbE